jgi:uncharacterized protein (TIGR02611 family)
MSLLESTRATDLDTVATAPTRRERARAWIDAHRRLRLVWRILVGVVGVAVIAIGLVLVPLPGPGWLVVFGGLWILGLEFAAARRAKHALKRVLDAVARRFRAWRQRHQAARAR